MCTGSYQIYHSSVGRFEDCTNVCSRRQLVDGLYVSGHLADGSDVEAEDEAEVDNTLDTDS